MKVAVLFHGKLREHELKYKTQISNLVMKHFKTSYFQFHIDFFGHIWDENNDDYTMFGDNIITEKNDVEVRSSYDIRALPFLCKFNKKFISLSSSI